MSSLVCARCGGCADGDCHGCERPRWCLGYFRDGHCNACRRYVLVPEPGTRGGAMVPCALDYNHGGKCRPSQKGS